MAACRSRDYFIFFADFFVFMRLYHSTEYYSYSFMFDCENYCEKSVHKSPQCEFAPKSQKILDVVYCKHEDGDYRMAFDKTLFFLGNVC